MNEISSEMNHYKMQIKSAKQVINNQIKSSWLSKLSNLVSEWFRRISQILKVKPNQFQNILHHNLFQLMVILMNINGF